MHTDILSDFSLSYICTKFKEHASSHLNIERWMEMWGDAFTWSVPLFILLTFRLCKEMLSGDGTNEAMKAWNATSTLLASFARREEERLIKSFDEHPVVFSKVTGKRFREGYFFIWRTLHRINGLPVYILSIDPFGSTTVFRRSVLAWCFVGCLWWSSHEPINTSRKQQLLMCNERQHRNMSSVITKMSDRLKKRSPKDTLSLSLFEIPMRTMRVVVDRL